ncbi:MAG: hypothetical protein M4579_002727 [Chaenotheca gracillima]|nr:MAG: hypothetical protein M4579_002727 [Chaenotheca gracillima]
MELDPSSPKKLCFITIGATAGFDDLISASLDSSFLKALKDANYTDLLIQYGSEGRKLFEKFASSLEADASKSAGLNLRGFDFNKKGLGQEMRAAKGGNGCVEGVVVSHAGSGSILDALRIGVPLIVVPNPKLLDNHQVELADELASQGYVVRGDLTDLPKAIQVSESLRHQQKPWPPVSQGPDVSDKGLKDVMEEEMGFLD